MDFEQDDNQSIPQQPGYVQAEPLAKPPKKRTGWKIFWGIFIALSVLANIVLFLGLISLAVVFATAREGAYTEGVIQPGPFTTKIAVIDLQGLIDDQAVAELYKQLKTARSDKRVKGVIIRVNSPGGMVSASDRINNEILQYRDQTDKPVVAFMHGIATSGGYYTSVACNKIVAEPTAITGSIGVIFGHFVLQQLLEEKLGIKAVIVKSGEKKDWPSLFSETTPEQIEYIEEKLIGPAFDRFVQIVADQRPDLELDDVKRLADGSIYTAAEALDEKLIDHIGYLDEAIEKIKELAEVEKARVIEYKKPFSMAHFLRSTRRSSFKIDRTTIYEMTAPQLMYLWTIY